MAGSPGPKSFTHKKIAYGGSRWKTAPAGRSRPVDISGVAYTQNKKSFTHEKIAYEVLGAGFGSPATRSIIPHFRGVVNRQNKQILLKIFVQIAQK
jgi:hypothetical protein